MIELAYLEPISFSTTIFTEVECLMACAHVTLNCLNKKL